MRLQVLHIGPRPNLAVALVSPEGMRPFIVNWEDVALYFVRGVQADAIADGTRETADLLGRLLAFPGLPALSRVLPAAHRPISGEHVEPLSRAAHEGPSRRGGRPDGLAFDTWRTA